MVYKITAGFLLEGPDVDYMETRNKDSGAFDADYPNMIILHYTAGRNLESAVRTLRDPEVKASAHLVIGREGQIKQLIPFNRIAWHAGKSWYGDRTNLNQYSIGIEMDNAGRLTKAGSKYVSWFGRAYPEDEVYAGVHRNETELTYWHAYTENQITRTFEICHCLNDKFGVQHLLGHDEIAPGRKIDPGPAFPIDKLCQQLFEDRGEDLEEVIEKEVVKEVVVESKRQGVVTASELNFRTSPSREADLISPTLMQGTSVEILEEKRGWYRVKVGKTGWVKKNYISLL